MTGTEQTTVEPKEAFPYRPPSDEIKITYKTIFDLDHAIEPRFPKLVFDKLFSLSVLVVAAPILLLLWIAYKIEGIIIPENRGPLFYHYNAMSAGEVIPKYKIRVIKTECIDPELAKIHDWHAFKNEWNPACRTHVGQFVKSYYLDELPQFFSVLKGDMSMVGPRPLAIHHYERDLEQGNVTRKLIRGGILGLGHIRKGTEEMGDPKFEYEYIYKCMNLSSMQVLRLDLWIIYRGLRVVLKGKGL